MDVIIMDPEDPIERDKVRSRLVHDYLRSDDGVLRLAAAIKNPLQARIDFRSYLRFLAADDIDKAEPALTISKRVSVPMERFDMQNAHRVLQDAISEIETHFVVEENKVLLQKLRNHPLYTRVPQSEVYQYIILAYSGDKIRSLLQIDSKGNFVGSSTPEPGGYSQLYFPPYIGENAEFPIGSFCYVSTMHPAIRLVKAPLLVFNDADKITLYLEETLAFMSRLPIFKLEVV